MPLVTAVVALYREKWEDIEMTLNSLVHQTYPKDSFDVLDRRRGDDPAVRRHAQTGLGIQRDSGISSTIVASDGTVV
jgi:hypothetical protein